MDNVVDFADRRRRRNRLERAQEWARMKHPSGDVVRCPRCYIWIGKVDQATHHCP
jgi:hypothetical protein